MAKSLNVTTGNRGRRRRRPYVLSSPCAIAETDDRTGKQHKESKRACDALRLQIAQGAVPPWTERHAPPRESAVPPQACAGNIRAAPVAQFFQTAILSNMKVIELAFCCYAVTDMPRARTFYEARSD